MADEKQLEKARPEFMPELGTGLAIGELSKALADSGFFGKAMSWQQCLAKIVIGRELGLGPVQAMTNIDVFDGNISLRSNLRAACIKLRPGYDFRVVEWTEQKCVIDFLRRGESVGVFTYTMADATRAGLAGKSNWKTHPRAMLYARAISGGQRAFMPEAMMGVNTYDPDEIAEIREKASTGNDLASINAKLSGTAPPPPPAPEVIEGTAVDVTPGGPEWPGQPPDDPFAVTPEDEAAYAARMGKAQDGLNLT